MKIKKIAALCSLLILVNTMIIPSITYASNVENDFIYGDADADGKITSSDAAIILQKVLLGEYEMPIEKKTDDYLKYVDVDCDKMITSSDAANVLQKTLISTFSFNAEKNNDDTVSSAAIKLEILDAYWMYCNTGTWMLKSDVAEDIEYFYVRLYKNDSLLSEYQIYDFRVNNDFRHSLVGSIDFSSKMKNDPYARYTFDVKAVSKNPALADSEVKIVGLDYVYQQNDIQNIYATITSDNLIQIINSKPTTYPVDFFYDIDKEYIVIKNSGYISNDAVFGRVGNVINCLPIKEGTTKIIIGVSDENTGEIIWSKQFLLEIDDALKVKILHEEE